MNSSEKMEVIAPWIDPKERVTVQFNNQRDLTAEVTGCTEHLIDLSLETPVPHMRQNVSIPLSAVEVSEDVSHYTRDPNRPLKHKRLMLVINGDRPVIIY